MKKQITSLLLLTLLVVGLLTLIFGLIGYNDELSYYVPSVTTINEKLEENIPEENIILTEEIIEIIDPKPIQILPEWVSVEKIETIYDYDVIAGYFPKVEPDEELHPQEIEVNSYLFRGILSEYWVDPIELDEFSKDLLAKIIKAEVGYDYTAEEVLLMTGQVVLNRMKSPAFPDTIEDILYQEGQYGCSENIHEYQPDERILKIVDDLLAGRRILPEEIVFQSEYENNGIVYAQFQFHDMIMYYSYSVYDPPSLTY